MLFIFYPDTDKGFAGIPPDSKVRGIVAKEIEKLARSQKDLYMRVQDFLRKLLEAEDVQPFFDSGFLAGLQGGLYEMRIPPQRKGGVFRIYFCYNELKASERTLVLLDAELKHRKEARKIGSAREKLEQYRGFLKRTKR